MIKRTLPLLLALIMLTSLFACTEPVVKETPVHLKFVCLAWQKKCIEAFKDLVAEWNAKNPEVQVDYVQGDWRNMGTDMMTDFSSGNTPDIIHYWTSPIITWNREGLLADLSSIIDDELRNDIPKEYWDLFTCDNHVGAIPIMMEKDVIIYNKTMFKEAGIVPPSIDHPWNYNQLLEAAQILTDKQKGRYGMGIGLGQASRHLNEMFATKWGCSLIDEATGRIKVTEDYLAFMREIRSLIDVHTVLPIESLMVSPEHIAPDFVSGKYAMLPGIGCFIRGQIAEYARGTDLDWGVLPAFSVKNSSCYGAIQTLSVPADSAYKDQALEFVRFMVQKESMSKVAYGDSLFPVRKSAQALPAFQTGAYEWNMISSSLEQTIIPPYVNIPGYQEFMDGPGLILYLRYLGGKLTDEEFAYALEREGNAFIDKMQRAIANGGSDEA